MKQMYTALSASCCCFPAEAFVYMSITENGKYLLFLKGSKLL